MRDLTSTCRAEYKTYLPFGRQRVNSKRLILTSVQMEIAQRLCIFYRPEYPEKSRKKVRHLTRATSFQTRGTQPEFLGFIYVAQWKEPLYNEDPEIKNAFFIPVIVKCIEHECNEPPLK